MVWSNMRLHREPDPLLVIQDWRAALSPDGFVMFSGLGPGSLGLLREIYFERDWGAPMTPLVDMHDWGDMLVEAGFADPVMDQETLTLTFSSPQALLAELRTLGGNTARNRCQGLRSRDWLRALEARLAKGADSSGRIALQFELVYGHAFRAADRGPAVAETTRIGLGDMKLMLRNPGRPNGVG
jgi:malonyl-CoA O-methyltransferase